MKLGYNTTDQTTKEINPMNVHVPLDGQLTPYHETAENIAQVFNKISFRELSSKIFFRFRKHYCLKNAFRELSSKVLFRFSQNLTSPRKSQKTKIHLFLSVNMQKISGKLTKFSVFALKQFTILEHGINLA